MTTVDGTIAVNRLAVRLKKDLINFSPGDKYYNHLNLVKKFGVSSDQASLARNVLVRDGLLIKGNGTVNSYTVAEVENG